MFTISLKHPILRGVFLLALVALLASLSWFITRTALGDSLATFGRRVIELDETTRLDAATAAVRYTADDPGTRLQSALIWFDAGSNDSSRQNLTTAIQELRVATKLNPQDYRAWLWLGRALERSSENNSITEARAALERAVHLAPQHFEPHWSLGNFLLRHGEREAASEAFQIPMANRPEAFPLIFNSVWEAYQGDVAALLRSLKPPPSARASLALALVQRKHLPEALAVWKGAEQNPENAKLMTDTLLVSQNFAAAFDVWRNSPGNIVPPRDTGSLLANGGFDQNIALNAKTPFLTWQINSRDGVMISLDQEQPQAGVYSLRISFGSTESSEIILAQQTVPVVPATSYRLSFAVRTQDLKSFSPPLVEVIDATGADKLNAASPPPELTISNWRDSVIEFTTQPTTEAVTVRIIRRACTQSPCPLSGRAWFDSFRLATK